MFLNSYPSYDHSTSRIPLSKFSHVTTSSSTKTSPWKHFTENSRLFAVFDNGILPTLNLFAQNQRLLKVVNGDEIKVSDTFNGHFRHKEDWLKKLTSNSPQEQVSLNELANQAAADEERARQATLEDADRYCNILVRKPFIAIRYKLPDHQTRRIQMNFSHEFGFEEALNILVGFGLRVQHKDALPQEPSNRNLLRPSTASTNVTYQSGSTAATTSTNGTAISAYSGSILNPYGLEQRSFGRARPDNSIAPQNRIYPRPSSTTSIVPGPSIPESIISKPNGWGHGVTQNRLPPPTAHGDDLDRRPYTTAVSSSTASLQQHYISPPDPLRRSLFSTGERLLSADPMLELDHLNQIPAPPKRKLPFPGPFERAKQAAGNRKARVSKRRRPSADAEVQEEPKSYNLRRREINLHTDASQLRSTSRKNQVSAKNPPRAKKTKHSLTKSCQTSPTKRRTNAPARSSVPGEDEILSKEESARQEPSKMSNSKRAPTKNEAPKTRAARQKPLETEKNKLKPPEEAPTKTRPAKKTVAKQPTTQPSLAPKSVATQTETPKRDNPPACASQATQTEALFASQANTIYISRSTQTETSQYQQSLRPALAPVSSNLVPTIEMPSRGPSRRVALVNKFNRGGMPTNKFNPPPDRVRRGGAGESQIL